MKPDVRVEIISTYGKILEKRRLPVGRELDLPFPKELIRQALAEELVNPSNPEIVNPLESGFLELEAFVSDEEFEPVRQFYEAVAEAQRIVEKEGKQSAQKAASLIANTPEQAMEIQRKIGERMTERKKQMYNLRLLRDKK